MRLFGMIVLLVAGSVQAEDVFLDLGQSVDLGGQTIVCGENPDGSTRACSPKPSAEACKLAFNEHANRVICHKLTKFECESPELIVACAESFNGDTRIMECLTVSLQENLIPDDVTACASLTHEPKLRIECLK